MARRIVFAENRTLFGKSQDKLFVDQWIDIDWRHHVRIDPMNGDMFHRKPTFKVGLPGVILESGSRSLTEYGEIVDPEDVEWLTGATHGSYMAGRVMVDEVKDVLARVHQLGLRRDFRDGFALEVLTGSDTKEQIDKANRAQAFETFKELWWRVPLVIGLFVIVAMFLGH